MILDGATIANRISVGEIFKRGSHDIECIKEASYALRLAHDFCMIDGRWYEENERRDTDPITIQPGRIGILSTIERFHMPGNLVGKVGLRLNIAAQGLVGLWGMQVDPWYGADMDHDRFYARVANLGNQPIVLMPGDPVFNVEFTQPLAPIAKPDKPKRSTWRLFRTIGVSRDGGPLEQADASWSYLTRAEADFAARASALRDEITNDTQRISADIERRTTDLHRIISTETAHLRDGLQSIVLFGVFLVAATLLAAVIAVIIGLKDVPTAQVPTWVTGVGWLILMILLGLAGIVTAAVGVAAIVSSWTRRDTRPVEK